MAFPFAAQDTKTTVIDYIAKQQAKVLTIIKQSQ